MQKLKVIFFGTHNFAIEILKGLLKDPSIYVEKVITQTDKPVGRKKKLTPPPIKIFALEHKLKVEQYESLKKIEPAKFKTDLGITAQYGLLIPKQILTAPKYGILNVHTSLLPKYRGATPIQSAIMNGETETGITIMQMTEGLDEGPILTQVKTSIGKDETYPELDERLAKIGSEIIANTALKFVQGNINPQEQDDSEATITRQLKRENGIINWNLKTQEIYNLYRALTPWPGIYTTWQGKMLKILKIKPATKKVNPGEVKIENGQIFVGTSDTSTEVLEIQLEGKKPMDAKTFINGFQKIDSARLME